MEQNLSLLFIYLTALGLSCSTQESSVQGTGSAVTRHEISCSVSCQILAPWPGVKPTSPALQSGFSTTGPLEKSLCVLRVSVVPDSVTPWTGARRFLCPWDFQAQTLEPIATSSSRGPSWPRNWTLVSCISYTGRRILYHCITWEVWSLGTSIL